MNTQRISVLGLGSMGRALASTLLKAGHEVTIWNRTPGKAGDLRARGAREAPSLEEAIETSDLTLACLLDDASVRETLTPAIGKLTGRTLVNLTSGSARQARELAGWLAKNEVRFLAGGIMAVPPAIGTDEAFILYSGPRDLFDHVAPVLASLARPHWVGEDHGYAALYDMGALSGMYGMIAGVSHATALVDAEGGDVGTFIREVLHPWMKQMLPLMFAEPDPGESNAEMQATGLETMISTSQEAGVPGDLTGHLRAALWEMRRAAA
ncbi:NAD(P)-dependent oxidoreductase [Actinomadura sp. GC306]|uniref:NAD(P)-dependent oxidoreductase n=1 Tax=Actinomadura sp. GC306 TaxID=2530367 RepID=UPI0010479677|nr:NAD(P)-binding domain-containing protein [Actinomadura sp. GC306]TDC65734.1 NAD(P)-dependent oxidoreductase [Actinomadura sp. GC306]